jgi:hypothetical protein
MNSDNFSSDPLRCAENGPRANMPYTSVGGTVAASISNFDHSRYCVGIEKTVLDCTEAVCSGVEGLIPSTRTIVESLVWCFVARRSQRVEMFSAQEYGRFVKSMRATAQRITGHQSDDVREQSYVKYWIDSYLAAVFLDAERPPRETWNVDDLFSGWCLRFVHRAIARRDLPFLYSLQKGSKQMWDVLKDENVRKSIRKSKERLCSARGVVSERMTEVIREVSDGIFRRPRDPSVGKRFMPSGSAVLQASLRDGGALSLFEPLSVNHSPVTLPGGKTLFSLHGVTSCVDAWRQSTWDTATKVAVEQAYALDEDGYFKEFECRFVHIFEPGKIRNISVSDGFVATALQPLQGFMLSAWKSTQWSTMLLDDLEPRIRDMDVLVDEPYWCSGDYEAATDLLYKDATLSCLNSLSWHPLHELAWTSIATGRMCYPDEATLKFFNKKKEFIGERLPMYEGQLMGHTLSFPMLCVINLSVLKESISVWIQLSDNLDEKMSRARRGKLIYENALVNGDDILFKGDRLLIDTFKKVASSVGFKTSQGKNYVSPDTCLINSQVYLRRNGKMVRQGYLNLRLVKGNNIKARVAGGEKPVTPEMIGKDLSKMARICPWTACSIPAAFRRWDSDWKTSWFKPNWYLPVHLGGYGVDLRFAPKDLQISRAQRFIAAAFVSDPRLALYRKTGSMQIVKLAAACMNYKVVAGDYVPQEFELIDEWLGRFAYASRAKDGVHQQSDADIMVARRFRKHSRLSPMSAESLVRYWYAQVFSTGAPTCPPIGDVKMEVPRLS